MEGKESALMANSKRTAAIVTVGFLAIVGIASMPAYRRLKELEAKSGVLAQPARNERRNGVRPTA